VRRGFKSEAERIADQIRSALRLARTDPLDPQIVAEYLGATLRPADALVSRARLEELKAIQDDAFSAVTFRLPDTRVVVVYNPLHKEGRRRSDIAHELSHLILRHETRTIEVIAGQSIFTCNPEQEEEANWLAGCLLLPRPLLLGAARSGVSVAEVAVRYGVSESMARFRMNASGAMLQASRGRGARIARSGNRSSESDAGL
jgi:Zn-dependent peptidase ImmA (M78 family)